MLLGFVAKPIALLAEQEYAIARKITGLQRHRAGHIVDTDEVKFALLRPRSEVTGRLVMPDMLVAIRHHRSATIPPLAPDNVHFGGEKSVGGAHHRTDIEVVAEVLDGNMKGVPT